MSARRPTKGLHGTATATTTPRILNLSRRSSVGGRPSRGAGRAQQPRPAPRPVNLGALFEMERRVRGLESAPASPPPVPRATRAPQQEDGAGEQEEKWRFQAEILRAECNFLRMEREVALRKLDCHRGQMEAALKTAVETLASGRKKIDGRGEVGVAAALDEGIEDLEEMMEELRVEKQSGRRAMSGTRELRRSHGRNFDRQASSLRRRLEKMPSVDAEPTICKDIREIAHAAAATPHPPADQHSDGDDHVPSANLSDVEMLRVKMEGMSNGMRERMAEYGRRLEAVAGGDNAGCRSRKCGNRHSRKPSACSQRSWSGSSNASNGNVAAFRQNASHGPIAASQKHRNEQQKGVAEDCKLVASGSCCDCKEIVGKIMKQVRAESEQWTEMQDMLEQVRMEMQELQSSRDAWQRRAIASDISLGSLNSQMLEWKQRAQASEHHAEDLQKKVTELQGKLHTFKSHFPAPSLPSRSMVRNLQDGEPASSQGSAPPPVTTGLRQGEREARPDLPREALAQRDAEALAAAGDRQHQPAAAVAAVSTDHG